MRTRTGVFLTAISAIGLISAVPTEARAKKDWVCWMTPSGIASCAHLPEPYHVRDIPMKPHKHDGLMQPCRHCSVDFTLTHPNIHDLGNYTDNSSMRRFHDATLYGEKKRRIRD